MVVVSLALSPFGSVGGGARGLDADFGLRRGDSFRVDLSLSIPAGTTVALLGPNGAGKSTAVAVIAGLLPIDSGAINLAGTTLDEPVWIYSCRRRSVGSDVSSRTMLFPPHDGHRERRVRIAEPGVSRAEAMERAGNWLERLEW